MKKIKQIIVIAVLLAIVLLIGYSCHTHEETTSYPAEYAWYDGRTYFSNGDTMVAFMGATAWYESKEQPIVLLSFESYSNGEITMKHEGETYRFFGIGKEKLLDGQTGEILKRGSRDG